VQRNLTSQREVRNKKHIGKNHDLHQQLESRMKRHMDNFGGGNVTYT